MDKQQPEALPDYYKRMFDRIDRYRCRSEFDELVRLGANREELMKRLVRVSGYSAAMEPRKPDKRRTKQWAKRIRATAKLLTELDEHRYGRMLLGSDWRQTRNLPTMLSEYSARLEQWSDQIEPRWEPLKTAAICQVIWFVKNSTGRYQDALVAPLIGAFLYRGELYPEALKKWRERHRSDIQRLGPLDVLPVIPRPPRKMG